MNYYGFNFTWFEIGAFGFLLLMFTYQSYFYIRYIGGVLRRNRNEKKAKISFITELPPVSVIICAKNEEENLQKFLPFILDQDYPDFEVIVINDGSSDNTGIFLDRLKKVEPRLKTSFVPMEATNKSTKKLGITLGVKAAKNDILILTDADCMPEDKTWLRQIARNFDNNTEFVLGYGAYFNKESSFLNKLISYETLFIGLQYMGMALAGKPYMGVGRNLAYRKSAFLRYNGFASNLNLRSGDDDLIINQHARKDNTRVECASDSITWSEPKRNFTDWYFQKKRHLSISGHYSLKSKWRLSLEPFTRFWFYLAFIICLCAGNWITFGAASLLFVIRYGLIMAYINKSAKHFGEKKHYFTILIFDILLPLITANFLLFDKKISYKTGSWK